MKCINHPQIEAESTCIACGQPICETCRVSFKGENYCKKCLAEKAGEKSIQIRSPLLAVILSFFIAGAGQVYNGQLGKGILIFLTAWLFIPWVYGIFDAYLVAQKINEGKIQLKERTGCLITLIVGVLLIVPVMAILGILAVIAIPNFIKARDVAGAKICVANLRTIREVKEKYRIEKGLDYNAAIPDFDQNGINDGDGIPDVLEVYITGEIVCPAGGRYEVGQFSDSPRCSVGDNNSMNNNDDHILKE